MLIFTIEKTKNKNATGLYAERFRNQSFIASV